MEGDKQGLQESVLIIDEEPKDKIRQCQPALGDYLLLNQIKVSAPDNVEKDKSGYESTFLQNKAEMAKMKDLAEMQAKMMMKQSA